VIDVGAPVGLCRILGLVRRVEQDAEWGCCERTWLRSGQQWGS
jgi:hypothetical protein